MRLYNRVKSQKNYLLLDGKFSKSLISEDSNMSVLWEALNNINNITIGLLLLSLGLALFYEMINGFHDTANAVAMIIYTNSMEAKYSVIMSG